MNLQGICRGMVVPQTAVTALLYIGMAAPIAAQSSPTGKASRADLPVSAGSASSGNGKQVSLTAVVHDKHGGLVQNLTLEQFQLWVDKKPAQIRSFNRDSDGPLTLGLLVDVSTSQHEVLGDERKASQAFLDAVLTGTDQSFIVQFGKQVDLLQDATSSRTKLQDGLQQLGTISPADRNSDPDNSTDQNNGNTGGSGNNGGSPPWSRGGRGSGGSNVPTVGPARRPNDVLYDALFLSADEVVAKQPGRKALIVLSDGMDHGSKESLASATEAAQRADVIVYAIYIKGQAGKPDHSDRGFSIGDPNQCDPYGPPGGYPGSYPPYGYPGGDCTPHPQTGSVESSDGRKLLERITDQTGGRLFEMDKKNSLADIYKQIGDELHAEYRMTFTPDKDASTDGYHRIDLSLKGDPKELFVQTRDGYFMGEPD